MAYGIPRPGIRSKPHLRPKPWVWQHWIPTVPGWGWNLHPGTAETTTYPSVPQQVPLSQIFYFNIKQSYSYNVGKCKGFLFSFYGLTCGIWKLLGYGSWSCRPMSQPWQHPILNPLSKVRDWTRVLRDTMSVSQPALPQQGLCFFFLSFFINNDIYPGIEPASPWTLVRLPSAVPQWELLLLLFLTDVINI